MKYNLHRKKLLNNTFQLMRVINGISKGFNSTSERFQNKNTWYLGKKVIDINAGAYIIRARRKRTDWFIDAVTNFEKERNSCTSTLFFTAGDYTAEIYADRTDANPDYLQKQTKKVTGEDIITLKSGSGNGVIKLNKEQIFLYYIVNN